MGRASVEYFGDVRVLHHRQRLPLLLEAGHDFDRVHAEFDDLQRDAASHRLLLLRDPDYSDTARADLLAQLVRADQVTGFLGFQPRQRSLDSGLSFGAG